MTTIDWQGGLPGIYRLDSAGNWVGGTLPGTADTALIDATSSGPYQLTGTLTLDAFGVVADTATLGTGSSPALVVSDGNGPLELSITGGGTLAIAPTGTVDGSGIVEVGQTATETDLLSLRGTLLAGNADLLPGGTLTVAPGAMLAGDLYMLGGTLEAVSAPGTAGGTVTLANPLHLATLSAIGALGGITLALGGGIDGASSIELFGNIVLSGPDSGTGDTTIESGAVTLAAASALGSGNLTLENGALISSLSQTLDIGGFSLAFGETGTLAAATGTTLDVVASGGGFGGTLAFGAPGEAGTVLLNPGPSGFGVNFAVDVAGGTFLDTGEFLGGHNATIAAGATFDLAGIPDLSGNTLAGTGVLTDSGAPAVFQTQGPVFAGTITGAVILDAADTTTLTGADFATQAATIFGGSTLQLGIGGTGPDLAAGVFDQGVLIADRSDSGTIGPLGGGGTFIQEGSGTITLDGVNSITGNLTLEAGTLALAASGAAGGAGIVFAGHANLVVQDAAFAGSPADATLTNPITGFVPGTTIDLPGLPFADGVTADLAGGTLTASGGGDSFALNIVGGPSSGMLLTAPDGSGGTEIIACFAAGTRIATTHGEIPVEQLREGDLVWTASGRLAPITWLGHRRLVPRRLADPETVMPVRIRAGAFADSVPLRDILLSPDHAVLVAGRLIPVRHLVNGATIRREKVASITYWHVELAAHDVLLAEGLPCETYLDTGNRAAFANAGTVVLATPEFARAIWVLGGCAELAPSGSPVEHARAILTARAQALGWRLRRARLTVRADGRILCAERLGAAWRVELPPGTRQIRLVSEAAVPAETEGADDRRRLGIAIAGLVLDNAELMPGDPRFTEGWHSPEPFGQWTNGNAALDVTLARHLSFRQTRMATIWKQGGKSRFGSFSTEKEHTSCA
jgi:autotransporter-associated beta strand protein